MVNFLDKGNGDAVVTSTRFFFQLGRDHVSQLFSERNIIYITYAVGYILQREVFRFKYDRAAGVF
jgi:hypothetical protein